MTMEPVNSEGETTKPAVGYIRLSASDGDVGQPVEAQKLVMERLAEKLGLRVVRRYIDMGSHGRRLGRPALQELSADALSGNADFDRVLLHGMDRLSRNAADLAAILETLANAGVEPVFVK